MKEKLKLFLKENYQKDVVFFGKAMRNASLEDYECASIQNYIDDNKNESMFQTLLFKYIDERNLKDSDVYNKVNIDRRLFSKIRSDENYHPSKETVILLGLSLEFSEREIIDLLESASYSLPKNNYFDLIIRFCFINKIYNINNVNELLYDYNCKCI
jgi:hypothetical protein